MLIETNSKFHNVILFKLFNKGKFDVLIANDKADIEECIEEGQHTKTKMEKKIGKKAEKDEAEFDLSRGIDFQNVSNVINFDFPTTPNQYIHRAGRTARGDNKGFLKNFCILTIFKALNLCPKFQDILFRTRYKFNDWSS